MLIEIRQVPRNSEHGGKWVAWLNDYPVRGEGATLTLGNGAEAYFDGKRAYPVNVPKKEAVSTAHNPFRPKDLGDS